MLSAIELFRTRRIAQLSFVKNVADVPAANHRFVTSATVGWDRGVPSSRMRGLTPAKSPSTLKCVLDSDDRRARPQQAMGQVGERGRDGVSQPAFVVGNLRDLGPSLPPLTRSLRFSAGFRDLFDSNRRHLSAGPSGRARSFAPEQEWPAGIEAVPRDTSDGGPRWRRRSSGCTHASSVLPPPGTNHLATRSTPPRLLN